MSTDLSLVTLVLNASILVQIVMVILAIASLVSWTMIFRKRLVIGHAVRAADTFDDQFWSGVDLVEIQPDRRAADRGDRNGTDLPCRVQRIRAAARTEGGSRPGTC